MRASLLPLAALLAALDRPPAGAELALSHTDVEPKPPCDSAEISIAQECPGRVAGIDWAEFADALYVARSRAFEEGPAATVAEVHALLARATAKFSSSFECLPALISTYFTLARALMLQGRQRRALAFLQLGFIFVRDRGFSECTPWPVQGFDMMLAGRTLTEQVRALDSESVLRVPTSHRVLGLRVAIVTICAYAPDEMVRVLCQENRELYNAVHGYDVHFFTDAVQIGPNVASGMNVEDGVHKKFFWKVNAVKNVLDSGAYDWVLWMDCDAFFMDPLRTIDSVIAMYTGNATLATRLPTESRDEPPHLAELRSRLRSASSAPPSLIIAVDSTGINNGVWMIRDTPWAHNFLRRWWHSDILEGPGREHNCSDQSTMLHTLLHDRAMQLDEEELDVVEGPVWPAEVRVAAQEHLQSFHQATAETAMSRAWQEGDFIKHHPGCHYYRLPCQLLYNEAEGIFRNKVMAMRAHVDAPV